MESAPQPPHRAADVVGFILQLHFTQKYTSVPVTHVQDTLPLAPLTSLKSNPSVLCSGVPVSTQDREFMLQFLGRHDNVQTCLGTGGVSPH